jgi:hypothetical protein
VHASLVSCKTPSPGPVQFIPHGPHTGQPGQPGGRTAAWLQVYVHVCKACRCMQSAEHVEGVFRDTCMEYRHCLDCKYCNRLCQSVYTASTACDGDRCRCRCRLFLQPAAQALYHQSSDRVVTSQSIQPPTTTLSLTPYALHLHPSIHHRTTSLVVPFTSLAFTLPSPSPFQSMPGALAVPHTAVRLR